MKIMILTDLEGVSGVNGKSNGIGIQLMNEPVAVQELVNEVNACCEGLLGAGAEEIVVVDGHGASNSIDPLKLHPAASIMHLSGLRPVCYLDSSFDALVQIGAHAMHTSGSYLCHSFASSCVANLELNGREIGEIGIASRIAGYFRVPTILVSGDEAACREARADLGEQLVTIPTKQPWGRYSAVQYPPEKVCRALREGAEKALRQLDRAPIPPQEPHYVLRLRTMSPDQADPLEMIGGKRLDEATVEFESDDFLDVYAQRNGWAGGVHNRRFGITPEWLFSGIGRK